MSHNLTEEDHDKIASLVVDNLKEQNRPDRDDEFVEKIAEMLIEHRSPCHDLSSDDVDSLKVLIKKYKRLEKGVFLISVAVVIFLIKSAYGWVVSNIHWGQSG